VTYRAEDGAREHLASEQRELELRRAEYQRLRRDHEALIALRTDLDAAITARRGKTPNAMAHVRAAAIMAVAVATGVLTSAALQVSDRTGFTVMGVGAALYIAMLWRSSVRRKAAEKELAAYDARKTERTRVEVSEDEGEGEGESESGHST